jgi:hypothetical protein
MCKRLLGGVMLKAFLPCSFIHNPPGICDILQPPQDCSTFDNILIMLLAKLLTAFRSRDLKLESGRKELGSNYKRGPNFLECFSWHFSNSLFMSHLKFNTS